MVQPSPHTLILLIKSIKMFKSLMLIYNSMNPPPLLLISTILTPPLLLVPANLNYQLHPLTYKMTTTAQQNQTKVLLISSQAWDILEVPFSFMMVVHKTTMKMKMMMTIRMII